MVIGNKYKAPNFHRSSSITFFVQKYKAKVNLSKISTLIEEYPKHIVAQYNVIENTGPVS